MPRKKRRKTTTRARQTTTKTRRRSRKSTGLDLKDSTRRQVSGIMQICLGVLLVLVLKGNAGPVGDLVNQGLTFFFGAWNILFPAFLLISGTFHCFSSTGSIEIKRSTGLLICLLAFLGMVHLGAPTADFALNRDAYAGAIGFLMSVPFVLFSTKAVGYTVLASAMAGGIFIAFEPDLGSILKLISALFVKPPAKISNRKTSNSKKLLEEDEDDEDLIEEDQEAPELNIVRPSFAQQLVKEKAKEQIRKEASTTELIKNTLEMKDTRYEEWKFPEFDLLDSAHSELTVNDEELKLQARQIEEKLEQFGIDVTMREAHPGPTVTQFTLEPAEGVKLSKIGSLKDDLALALAAESLRMEAPIPGKSLVGIEMPNRIRTTVHLREILESQQFSDSSSLLSLPLGRNVSGEAIIADLADMPHLLIAGATGSGKSVCMNTFLAALLFQNAPHQLKFILIDPKRVELMPYNGIPHLLTPVITEAEKALQALRWTVAEMGRRLHRFSEAGARNIDEYNEKQMEEETTLPRVVIVIDELADLMMRQFRRDTETMVARIAQMARATGMHLIIATQRPSVDVITGLIKANIPTRISFRTVSAVDSRTIIDSIGAEDLLGKGDMLYMTASTPRPQRVQGIFVSTKEVGRVINAVKIAGGGKITEQIPMEEHGGEEEENKLDGYIDLDADDNGGDELFFEAVRVVQETGRASASLLQRQLKVGYARAARLLDIMEERNLIGPANGAKARKVFMEAVSN